MILSHDQLCRGISLGGIQDQAARAQFALRKLGLMPWDNSVKNIWIIFALSAVVLVSGPAQAATVTLFAQDLGSYDSSGNGSSSQSNYIVGGNDNPTEFRNFFVFDLSNITDKIVGASLDVFNMPGGYVSDDTSEIYQISEFSGSISDLTSGTGGIATFNDLGSGQVFGTREIFNDESDTIISTSFGSDGLVALSAASGLFAVGGALTSYSNGIEAIFVSAASGGPEPPESVIPTLTLETVSTIPIPAALPLFASAIFGLGLFGYRARQA
jgi:hypothetical protein